MSLGFIGAGNMGGAIINGFIKSGKVNSSDIFVIRKNKDALTKMSQDMGINPVSTYDEIVSKSDIIFLAVKPVMFGDVIGKIKDSLKGTNKLLVSMAAGITTDRICEMLGYNHKVVRIMPNVNAQIMKSTTAICKNNEADETDFNIISDLFSSIGEAVSVEESHFAIFTAIAGCSPAYVYLFVDALAKGAVKMGMNKKLALKIAASAVCGSAEMMLKNPNIHPSELCDMVCSPGGTTIEGVCTLDELGFTNAVSKAVENSILKDRKLSGK
ncbi:MAG: pyrroline-5-carboxylate reductase [Lachnospirales bacterium]